MLIFSDVEEDLEESLEDSLSINFLKDKTNGFSDMKEVFYNRTNFNLLDIQTGSITKNIHDILVINGGVPPKWNSNIGSSGTGKTSLSFAEAASIVNNYVNSFFYFYDNEGNTPISRMRMLTGWSDSYIARKVRYFGEGKGPLDILNQILEIVEMKKANRKHLLIGSGIRDINGAEIKIYPPTPILIDSIATLKFAGVDELEHDKKGNLKEKTELFNNIDGMRDARAIKVFIDRVKPFLTEYNIPIMAINHFTKEVQMSMFDRPDKKHPNLKAGMKMKGGDEIMFQSYTMREQTGKGGIDDRDPKYGDEIRGADVQVRYIKNKANVSNVPHNMVFDYKTGYRPELSDFEYIAAAKYGFSGSPMAYRLDIYPEISFTRKTLLDKCKTDEMFARSLSFTARNKMIYDMILMKEAPDLSVITEKMTDEFRYAYVYAHTKRYPFYKKYDIDWVLMLKIANGFRYFTKYEYRYNSFLTEDEYTDICEFGMDYMIGDGRIFYYADITDPDYLLNNGYEKVKDAGI